MPRTLCQQLRSPSILLLQDLCLAPSLGALAEPVCPRNPLKLDHRGTVKRLWLALVRGLCPQQLNCLHILEVLGRNRDQAGLGNRRIRGCLHTTDLGAARASLTRTRSVSTIATWTSSGSTLLSELAPGLGEEYVCARPEASGFFFLLRPQPTSFRPLNLPRCRVQLLRWLQAAQLQSQARGNPPPL